MQDTEISNIFKSLNFKDETLNHSENICKKEGEKVDNPVCTVMNVIKYNHATFNFERNNVLEESEHMACPYCGGTKLRLNNEIIADKTFYRISCDNSSCCFSFPRKFRDKASDFNKGVKQALETWDRYVADVKADTSDKPLCRITGEVYDADYDNGINIIRFGRHESCPNCGGTDLTLCPYYMYSTPAYYISCDDPLCNFSVPEFMHESAIGFEEGFKKAIDTWDRYVAIKKARPLFNDAEPEPIVLNGERLDPETYDFLDDPKEGSDT